MYAFYELKEYMEAYGLKDYRTKEASTMTFDELNRDQITQLKQAILCERQEAASWGELANADEIISDEEAREEYGDTIFSEDDFS